MKSRAEACCVACYSGFRYAQEPRAFTWRETLYAIDEVRRSWRSPRGWHFVVHAPGHGCFTLNYDDMEDAWTVDVAAATD